MMLMKTIWLTKKPAAEEADNDEEEAGRVNRYKRKMLTKKRKVDSIDAALDANNYNNFNIPNKQKWISGKFKSNDKNVPDTIYNFTNQQTKTQGRGRQRRADVITA